MGGILATITGALAGASPGPNRSTEVNVSCCSTEVVQPVEEEEIVEDEDSEDGSPRKLVRIKRSSHSAGSLTSHHSWRSSSSNRK